MVAFEPPAMTHSVFAMIDADITAHFVAYVGRHLHTVGVSIYRHNGKADDELIVSAIFDTSAAARPPHIDGRGHLCINGLILAIPASELQSVHEFMHAVGLPFELPAAAGEVA